ncbi:MAG TPA: ribosome small subunit-dependent GTPase A, partial [Baekduia sp.]|nr:ribosome small subunit-dependent GTPase A [Baekduia sp.]
MPHSTLGWDGDWARALADLQDRAAEPARVMAVHRGRVVVRCDSEDRLLPVLGGHRVLVGDWVAVRDGAVRAVLPRRTLLAREGAEQVANADLCLVVTSLNHDLSLRRAERFVALAHAGGVEALIVLTKGDLARDPVAEAARARERLGVDVVVLSAQDGWGVTALRARLQPGRTAVLAGSSGAGKSTLVNVLLGEQRQRTLAVREDDARGRHATTHRELFVLDDGALLVDTPGVRAVGLPSADGLDEAFADVAALAAACRFADCAHDAEPGCAVQAAIAAGTLDADRLRSAQARA